TWQSENVYLIKKYNFYVSSTLTIEPGTVVKFSSDGPDCILGRSGKILAQGTADKYIIFTSSLDDSSGGDTNNDGSASTPARKDWGGIYLNGYSGSVFHYCKFLYGGDGGNSGTLYISDGAQATVRSCIFAHNDGNYGGGFYSALHAAGAAAGTIIENNIFYDNVRPLTINCLLNLNDSNVFHNPDNITEKNTYNGIWVYTTDHITTNVSWGETEVPFLVDDGDFWINRSARLTLADNVVLKFTRNSIMLLADGAQAIVNRNGTGVFFTSMKDDGHKGDTNGDGNRSAPANGDWGGIYDDSGATPMPYYFNWPNILYDSH
ncbi:hypothetical protein JW935_08535, partial [candidate division KSB1 bacterium]|nr:hypothetical protein [candidate division KSB1 bacterium]